MSLLIYEKLTLAMADMHAVSKDSKNNQQGWLYRSIDQIKNQVSIVFRKHRIFYAPEVLEHTKEDRETLKGAKMCLHIVKVKFKITTVDGSFVESTTYGEAADSGDKGLGKAQTYAEKAMLLQVLLIPTEEQLDPDRDSHEFKDEPISMVDLNRLRALAVELGWSSKEGLELLNLFGVDDIRKLSKSQTAKFESKLRG